MPRYVLLRHTAGPASRGPTHWDLMLERDGTLWTWACPHLPNPWQASWVERLPDHRRHYLRYQGPLSGERGSVARWDQGHCRWVVARGEGAGRSGAAASGLSCQAAVRVWLRGRRLQGQLTLRPADAQRWRLLWTPL